MPRTRPINRITTSRFTTPLAIIYFVGYWAYIVVSAVIAWPKYSLFEWLSFVGIQFIVGTFWPVAIYLWHVGYFP